MSSGYDSAELSTITGVGLHECKRRKQGNLKDASRLENVWYSMKSVDSYETDTKHAQFSSAADVHRS